MKKAAIFTDLIGYEAIGRKTAVLTSKAQDFTLNDTNGKSVFAGKVTHFGIDKLSGDDVYIANFTGFEGEGEYYLSADSGAVSERFFIGRSVHSKVLDDMLLSSLRLRT